MNFCHLHVHDQFSLLDGYGTADQYAIRAKELGFKYLALTNHGNIDGLIKFQKSCKKHGIVPVLGVEFYIVPDMRRKEPGEKRHHIIALITNDTGLTNVMRMLSAANLEGFYKRPRIDTKLLLDNRDGLVFLSACVSSFTGMKGGIDLLLELAKTNVICLEIMPHNLPIQKDTNRNCLELSNKYQLPLVATSDCHYPLPHQAKTQEVLLAIQRKKKWTDEDRFTMKDWRLHMWSVDEMIHGFKIQGVVDQANYLQAMENTVSVAELCNDYTIGRKPVNLPKVCGREGANETELLWELARKGFSERLKFDDPLILDQELGPYHRRLKEEMEQICQMGFQRYFLIVWELIDWCKKNNIMTGPGRGSSGGSLVAYCLGITDVDPIKYGLIFARFISPERLDFPDIDMDFEDERRGEVIAHLEDAYGEHNVAGISTFLTMKGRAALRDVSRVFGIDPQEVDKAAKSIVTKPDGDPRSGYTIEDSYRESEVFRLFGSKYPEVNKLAIELEGQARGAGRHAAGICISSDDLRRGGNCNLCIRDHKLVANWDKGDAEHMGLMKFDVLGLSALTMLNYTSQLVKQNKNIEIDFSSLPLDDQKVFSEMSQGHSVGIFQMGTTLLIRLSKEMGVKEFNDIVLLNALSRPGPLASGMTDEFIARKTGRKPITYLHQRMKSFTQETLGIIIYQEQVMWAMYELAGLPWGTCEKVRKVMGKSKGAAEFNQYKQEFVEGCGKQGTLSINEAVHVWEALSSHGSYSFNKSHSVAYSLIGYWTAWLKFNHAVEFMAALLTHGGDEHKAANINEARRLGLKIELPKLGQSDATKWTTSGKTLYAPLTEIKGIGQAQAEQLTNRGSNNRGFFVELGQNRPNGAVGELLDSVGATGRKLSAKEMQEAQQYFSFNIVDKNRRFARLFTLEPKLKKVSEQDLLTCNIQADILQMGRYIKKIECSSCQLRQECRAPVNPSMGRYNVMIVGEAPGKDEDEQGIGFVGRAGSQMLWPELAQYGFSPLMFHITNAVKCWPSITKTPGRKHIDTCRPIIEDEIANLHPIVILAFGNTNVKLFNDRDGGITEMSGTTEWSDKYGCWLCWCVHPAAVLRSPSNRGAFEAGIRNFAEVLGRLGSRKPTGKLQPGVCPHNGDWGIGNNNYLECETCQVWIQCAKAII